MKKQTTIAEANYKVVLAIKDLNIEKYFKSDIECKVHIAKQATSTKLPLKEALTFDIVSFEDNYKCEILLENKNKQLARIDIKIPSEIENNDELEIEEEFNIKTLSEDKKPIELKGKYFFVILNKQFFKKKANMTQQTPEKARSFENEPSSNEKKLLSSEKLPITNKPLTQKSSEFKPLSATTNLSRTLSPTNINNSTINSASKLKMNTSQAKVNTGSPKKKIKASPIILDTIVNEVVNKHIENKGASFEEDMNKINECVYLTKIKNEEEDKRQEELINDSFGEKQDKKQEVENNYKESFELSPETLKKKYNNELSVSINKSYEKIPGSKTRLLSPQSKTKTDYSVLIENELWKYSNTYKTQNDYLKKIIYSLDMKLKDYNSLKKENELLKLELKKSEEARKELQHTIKETTHELKKENESIHNNYHKIIKQKTEYIENLKEPTEQNKTESLIQNETSEINTEIKEILLKNQGFNEIKAENEYLKNQLAAAEKKSNDFQNSISTKIKELVQAINEGESQKQKLFNENTKLMGDINNLQNQLNEEVHRVKEKTNEIETLQKKLLVLQTTEIMVKNLTDHNLYLSKELENKRNHIENLTLSVDNIKSDLLTSTKVGTNKEKKLYDNISSLKKQTTILETNINDQEETIAKLKKENSELKTSVSTLEQLLFLKDDVQKQYDFACEKIERLTIEKEHLKKTIDELTDQILNQEDKLFENTKFIQKIKKMIDEKEEYCNNLKKVILEMRSVGDYVPIRDDPVDNLLAQYINRLHSPENKLKILFIREGEGVYNFGTRKIYVAIHQDKINIRVGGGFLSIEEFLDIYTPLELEKLVRKDPVRIFNQNVAVNKTIAGRMAHEIEKPRTVELKTEIMKTAISRVKPNGN